MTNKILLAIITVIPVSILAVLIYFWSYADVTPTGVIVTSYVHEVPITPYDNIVVKRGVWNIDIKQGNENKISVGGGDQLIDSFMVVEVKNKTLYLDVKDEYKYFEDAYLSAYMEAPRLASISLSDQSNFSMQKFTLDSLNINLSGNSAFLIDSSSIKNLRIEANGITAIKSFNSEIESLNYQLSGNSMAIFDKAPSHVSGNIKGNSSLKLGDDEFYPENQIIDYRGISDLNPDISFVLNDKYLESLLVNKYGAAQSSYRESFKHRDSLVNRNRIFWYNIVAYSGGEFLDLPVSAWNFTYNRGKLLSYSIVYSSNQSEIYDNLKEKLIKLFGREPEEGLSKTLQVRRNGLEKYKIYSWNKYIDTLKSDCITILSNKSGAPAIGVVLLPDIDNIHKSFSNVSAINKNVRKDPFFEALFKKVFEQEDIDLTDLLKIRVQ